MNKTMRPKASQIGIWRVKTDGVRWSWLQIDPDMTIVDRRSYGARTQVRLVGSTFRLEITESNDIYYIDGYCVTTCGSSGKGGTRHHHFKTNLEAQKYALKWLDYRIAVCVA